MLSLPQPVLSGVQKHENVCIIFPFGLSNVYFLHNKFESPAIQSVYASFNSFSLSLSRDSSSPSLRPAWDNREEEEGWRDLCSRSLAVCVAAAAVAFLTHLVRSHNNNLLILFFHPLNFRLLSLSLLTLRSLSHFFFARERAKIESIHFMAQFSCLFIISPSLLCSRVSSDWSFVVMSSTIINDSFFLLYLRSRGIFYDHSFDINLYNICID